MINFPVKKNNRVTSPLSEMESLRQEMDRFFDLSFPGLLGRGSGLSENSLWSPSVDVIETHHHYQITADLPGLDKKDISVELEETALTITGERRQEATSKDTGYLRSERHYGRFRRRLHLEAAIDISQAKAVFKNGELKLTLPKKEESRTRQIQIDVE